MSSRKPILAIRSLTRFLKSTGKQGFQEGTHTQTDIATYRLNWPGDQISFKKLNLIFNIARCKNLHTLQIVYALSMALFRDIGKASLMAKKWRKI